MKGKQIHKDREILIPVKIVISLIFIFFINHLYAQSTPSETISRMGRGINLGNILSAPYEGNWAPAVTENYVDQLYRLGFKSVRIPIRFENQTTPTSAISYKDANGNYIGSMSQYQVNTSYLNRIEEVVDWCLQRNLITIIDVHGDHWFWETFDPESNFYKTGSDRLANIDRFKAIWRDISVKFKDKPDGLIFEIMNEPYFSMSQIEVNSMNAILLPIIRSTNPTRNVILTGGGANSYLVPMQIDINFFKNDPHLLATFHYYRPFSFTSSATQNNTDNDWGTLADKITVDNEFDQVYQWATTNHIEIILGEYGADNEGGYNYYNQTYGAYGGPDTASRVAYHQYLTQAAVARGFVPMVWDAGDKSGKTIYKVHTDSWVKEVRNVVLGSDCQNETFINNANIECNYDYNWNLILNETATAKIKNATPNDSYSNSKSLEVVVQNAATYQDVLVVNDEFSTISIKNFTVNLLAKAGTGNQSFQWRIKATVNSSTQYFTSPVFTLTTSYTQYSHEFNLPENTLNVRLELMCGNNTGSYFFDDFNINTTTVSVENIDYKDFKIFPNPFSSEINFTNISVIKDVSIHNLLGETIYQTSVFNSSLNLSFLEKGIYFLEIKFANEHRQSFKIIKN